VYQAECVLLADEERATMQHRISQIGDALQQQVGAAVDWRDIDVLVEVEGDPSQVYRRWGRRCFVERAKGSRRARRRRRDGSQRPRSVGRWLTDLFSC
jgi:hypothetical protein